MNQTYYHISLETEKVVEKFIPKLPTAIYEHEDGSIPRISVSTSIEGCLSAVPWGGRKLENITSDFFSLHDEEVEEEIQLVFRVYEFEGEQFAEEDILSTEDLLYEGLVMDACNSDEHWLLKEAKPSRSYLVVLTGYGEMAGDVFSHDFYLLGEEEEPDDVEEYMVGSSTIISSIEMEEYESKVDIPYAIKWKEWGEVKKKLEERDFEMV